MPANPRTAGVPAGSDDRHSRHHPKSRPARNL